MLKMNDTFTIQSLISGDSLSLKILYLVQINFTISLMFQGAGFYGACHFCIRIDEVDNLCFKLTSKMSTKITNNDDDAYIEFFYTDNAVFVSGQIGGTHQDNYLKFRFETSEKFVKDFAEKFLEILKYSDDEKFEGQYGCEKMPIL